MTGQLVQLPSAATPATSRIITGTDSSPLLYVTGPLYSPRRAFGAFPALIPTFSTRRPITASTTQIHHGSGHPTAIRQRPTTNLHRRLRSSDDDYLSCQYRLACHTTYCIVAALAFVAEFGTAIAHLRKVLGDQTYESLTRQGEAMTTAEIVTYAYDQIDHARATLNAVSE